MNILIKNIIFNGKKQDIFVEGNKIKKISRNLNLKAKDKIDGKGVKAVLPGLINCHTHAAMSLLRGFADDLPLKEWWENKILPQEAKLTEEDIYWGTKLAILEMIKTGTTYFNDMYWEQEASIEAVEEMGIGAKIGLIIIDFVSWGKREQVENNWSNFQRRKFKTTTLSIAPHTIYTVSKENLVWAKNFAQKNNLILHIHVSETEKEVKDCQKKWKVRPVEYLEKIGFLGDNVVLAHGVWLSEKEIKILSKRKCSVVYNPCSNLKLVSGTMPYSKLKENRVNVCLGTDGPASNNNLDMFEEMKVGALIQKHQTKDPIVAPARELLDSATIDGARALKLNAGKIQVGKLADLILVDLNNTLFLPGHNFISDVVYSASGLTVTDSICNGQILMRDRKVKDERKIFKKTTIIAKNLINRK